MTSNVSPPEARPPLMCTTRWWLRMSGVYPRVASSHSPPPRPRSTTVSGPPKLCARQAGLRRPMSSSSRTASGPTPIRWPTTTSTICAPASGARRHAPTFPRSPLAPTALADVLAPHQPPPDPRMGANEIPTHRLAGRQPPQADAPMASSRPPSLALRPPNRLRRVAYSTKHSSNASRPKSGHSSGLNTSSE
jgi:hypothetical protein